MKRTQGMAGGHLTKPPYGYKADPADKKNWILDEETAAVVKRFLIYALPTRVYGLLRSYG